MLDHPQINTWRGLVARADICWSRKLAGHMDDYYKVLGLAPNAPQRQVRSRYWLLALNAHPDQAGDNSDPARFARYAQAYKVLGNPTRRREYNRRLAIAIEPRPLKPGHDLYHRLLVPPVEAGQGSTAWLDFVRYEPCSLCWCEGCHRCSYQGLVPRQVRLSVKLPLGLERNM